MILHVTDFHANLRWFRWLANVSARYELICMSGDMLDLNQHSPRGRQLEGIQKHILSIRAPLALVSGNHDVLASEGAGPEGVRWLTEFRGPSRWVDGDCFGVAGARFRCIPWMGAFPRKTSDDVWLTHQPPEGAVGISRGGAGWGSFELTEVLQNGSSPRIVLCGHIHDPQLWRSKIGRTWALNPGRAKEASLVPNFIEIDLKRGIAALTTETSYDTVRL